MKKILGLTATAAAAAVLLVPATGSGNVGANCFDPATGVVKIDLTNFVKTRDNVVDLSINDAKPVAVTVKGGSHTLFTTVPVGPVVNVVMTTRGLGFQVYTTTVQCVTPITPVTPVTPDNPVTPVNPGTPNQPVEPNKPPRKPSKAFVCIKKAGSFVSWKTKPKGSKRFTFLKQDGRYYIVRVKEGKTWRVVSCLPPPKPVVQKPNTPPVAVTG